jgi:hypothetical protein
VADSPVTVVAEGQRPIPSESLRTFGKETFEPVGRCHAVRNGSDKTVCGRPVADFVKFPALTWHQQGQYDWCEACKAELTPLRSHSEAHQAPFTNS